MHDRSFQQAVQDLQDRLSDNFQGTLDHMLKHRTTVAKATLEIEDERERVLIKNTLITGQMMALFSLMKEMRLIDEAQYDEFTEYLMRTFTC